MKHLPYCETETFEVRFDPQSASLPREEVDVLMPIKVPHASSPPCAHTAFRGSCQVGHSSRCHLDSQLDALSFTRSQEDPHFTSASAPT